MLQERYMKVRENLDNFFLENHPLTAYNSEEMNLVLDIEVSPSEDGKKAITYSNAIMSCDNETDLCYFYNNLDNVLDMLLELKTKKVNVYVHNLFYDIKPYLISFIERYGNNPIKEETYLKKYTNQLDENKQYELRVLKENVRRSTRPFSYSMCLKKGQLYSAKFYGHMVRNEKGREQPIEINFFDTYKIVPYSLQRCCSAFLDLKLPKDGLNYDIVRNPNDRLKNHEKGYIYDDVFGLSHLVKKLIIKGFDVNGKHVQYEKITNSSQSLHDYKQTLMEDYQSKQNAFADEEFYDMIDTGLMKTRFHIELSKNYDLACDILFKTLFPPQNYFFDGWIRHSYFGGLATVDFENVEKYSKRQIRNGVVLDVNSLYPWAMESKLLPVGHPSFDKRPYEEMNETYKKNRPLYIQEITIYDMKLKPNKMSFVQVKDNKDFNGRNVISENINLHGKKVPIKLILCNPLYELLFENYDIKSYKLGPHMSFQGAHNLFANYLNFWGEVKRTTKGAQREIAKLRQNALYGKFGSSGDNEMTNVEIIDGKFTVEHTHEEYITPNIYVAMSSFITSYCKQYLVTAINNNRDRFMYCDTDSLHLYGDITEVMGLEIHPTKYGAWDNENRFFDFKYIGAKRYAERLQIYKSENHILDNFYLQGKWDIKCCGLSDEIMRKVDNIDIFDNCEYTSKELKKLKYYKKEDTIYYYKDKECTIPIIGLIKSKKAKIVPGGTLIIEQPYMINGNSYFR